MLVSNSKRQPTTRYIKVRLNKGYTYLKRKVAESKIYGPGPQKIIGLSIIYCVLLLRKSGRGLIKSNTN